jgi:uncharacterized protein YdaU (DUF1376 family)
MDYYKRFMGDYQRDTGDLSLAQHGAYTVLLDHYYSVRKPLPASMEKLHRLCRATTKPEQDAVETVVEQFFPLQGDGLRHNWRADQELEKWEEMAESNREKGKLGGRPKRKPDDNPPGNPEGNPQLNPPGFYRDTKLGLDDSPDETRKVPMAKPGNNPLQIQNPNPDPEARNQSQTRKTRAHEGGEQITGGGEAESLDSLPFEQAIMKAFPTDPNPPNWMMALRNARDLVEDGLSTWPKLVAVAQAYGRYLLAGGASVNIAAHNFFDRRKGSHWDQAWDPPDAGGARGGPAKKRWHPDDGDPTEPKVAAS